VGILLVAVGILLVVVVVLWVVVGFLVVVAGFLVVVVVLQLSDFPLAPEVLTPIASMVFGW
jgi:hypothetical protein